MLLTKLKATLTPFATSKTQAALLDELSRIPPNSIQRVYAERIAQSMTQGVIRTNTLHQFTEWTNDHIPKDSQVNYQRGIEAVPKLAAFLGISVDEFAQLSKKDVRNRVSGVIVPLEKTADDKSLPDDVRADAENKRNTLVSSVNATGYFQYRDSPEGVVADFLLAQRLVHSIDSNMAPDAWNQTVTELNDRLHAMSQSYGADNTFVTQLQQEIVSISKYIRPDTGNSELPPEYFRSVIVNTMSLPRLRTDVPSFVNNRVEEILGNPEARAVKTFSNPIDIQFDTLGAAPSTESVQALYEEIKTFFEPFGEGIPAPRTWKEFQDRVAEIRSNIGDSEALNEILSRREASMLDQQLISKYVRSTWGKAVDENGVGWRDTEVVRVVSEMNVTREYLMGLSEAELAAFGIAYGEKRAEHWRGRNGFESFVKDALRDGQQFPKIFRKWMTERADNDYLHATGELTSTQKFNKLNVICARISLEQMITQHGADHPLVIALKREIEDVETYCLPGSTVTTPPDGFVAYMGERLYVREGDVYDAARKIHIKALGLPPVTRQEYERIAGDAYVGDTDKAIKAIDEALARGGVRGLDALAPQVGELRDHYRIRTFYPIFDALLNGNLDFAAVELEKLDSYINFGPSPGHLEEYIQMETSYSSLWRKSLATGEFDKAQKYQELLAKYKKLIEDIQSDPQTATFDTLVRYRDTGMHTRKTVLEERASSNQRLERDLKLRSFEQSPDEQGQIDDEFKQAYARLSELGEKLGAPVKPEDSAQHLRDVSWIQHTSGLLNTWLGGHATSAQSRS